MTVLLEMKQKLRLIYSKYEVLILPVAKFLLRSEERRVGKECM